MFQHSLLLIQRSLTDIFISTPGAGQSSLMGCRISFPFMPDWSSWGLAGLAVEEEVGGGEVKQYSWDKLRVELDISQYVIDKQEGGEIIRRPGYSYMSVSLRTRVCLQGL